MTVDINYLAVLVAGISSMVVGFLWYGVFFKKSWMRMMGITKESMAGMKMSANQAYALQFVVSLVMAWVLAHALEFASYYLAAEGAMAGVMAGFYNWLGFIVPVTVGVVLWEGKPWKLWLLNASNYLVTLIAMGIILAIW